jgi:hypothetical protein
LSKRKQEKQEWKPTKKHLSNLKKQQRRQKIILFSGIGIICAAFVMVVLGMVFQWYIPKVKPLKEIVLESTHSYNELLHRCSKVPDPGYTPRSSLFIDPVANILSRRAYPQYAPNGYTISEAKWMNTWKSGKSCHPASRLVHTLSSPEK